MTDNRPCPQCASVEHYVRFGWHADVSAWHEAAVAEANDHAKIWADSDNGSCSLSWMDLWLHHFTNAYSSLMRKKRTDAIAAYQDACYKKDYGARSVDICDYHAEIRAP